MNVIAGNFRVKAFIGDNSFNIDVHECSDILKYDTILLKMYVNQENLDALQAIRSGCSFVIDFLDKNEIKCFSASLLNCSVDHGLSGFVKGSVESLQYLIKISPAKLVISP